MLNIDAERKKPHLNLVSLKEHNKANNACFEENKRDG